VNPQLRNSILLSAARHALVLAGAWGFKVSDSEATEIAGALAAIIGIAWAALDKWNAHRSKEELKSDNAALAEQADAAKDETKRILATVSGDPRPLQ
jgi:hypothetical protein